MPTVKLVVLWAIPSDPESMNRYYLTRHLHLARQLPGLLGIVTHELRSKVYSRMAELHFEDAATLRAAMESGAGQAVAADAQHIETAYSVEHLSFMATEVSQFRAA